MSKLAKTFTAAAILLAALTATAGTAAHADNNAPDSGCTTSINADGTEATICIDYATPTNGDPTDPVAPIDGTVNTSDLAGYCAQQNVEDNVTWNDKPCNDTGLPIHADCVAPNLNDDITSNDTWCKDIFVLPGTPECREDMDACIRMTVLRGTTNPESTLVGDHQTDNKTDQLLLNFLAGSGLVIIGSAGTLIYLRRKEDKKGENFKE